MANHKAGGGIGSNKYVQSSVRTGAGSRGVNPGYAGQIGSAIGAHSDRGDLRPKPVPMHTKALAGPKFGNEVALNSKSAPGQGRTVHGSGSQHGLTQPKPEPQPGDILSEFGPERTGR